MSIRGDERETMMKKLLVYLDEDFHADLKEMAHRKKTTMAALVRYSLDATFEDDLDAIAGERGLAKYLSEPSSAISLDDYVKERGLVLPSGDNPAGKERPGTSARKAGGSSSRSASVAGK